MKGKCKRVEEPKLLQAAVRCTGFGEEGRGRRMDYWVVLAY